MIFRVKISSEMQLVLTVSTVLGVYYCAVFFPNAVVPFVILITLLGGIISPGTSYALFFPCLAPFMNVNDLPGLSGISLLTVFTFGILLFSLLRPRRFFQIIRDAPRYAVVGILLLLLVEMFSGLYVSTAFDATKYLYSRIIKTIQFLLGAAFAAQIGSIGPIQTGWVAFGILQVLVAIYIQVVTGSVLGLRDEAITFGIGSTTEVAALIGGVGYMAVVSAWFSLSVALRKRGIAPLIYLGLSVLFIVSSFYSGRRQSLLALVLSILIAITLRKGTRGVISAVALGIVFAGLLFFGPVKEFLSGRQSFMEEFRGGSDTFYVPIHRAGIDAFMESPVSGIGLGNYSSATLAMGIRHRGREGEGEAAHSTVVRILAETGILGAIGLLILSVGFVISLTLVIKYLHTSRRMEPMHLIVPALGMVLTGYTITILDQSDYSFFFGQTTGLMHIFIKGREERGNEARGVVGKLNMHRTDARSKL